MYGSLFAIRSEIFKGSDVCMWKYDPVSGLPEDRSYLECGLPPLLRESVDAMIAAWEKLDRGEVYLHWDCDFCNLQADINCAEVDQVISSEQAQYLREKYLRIEKEEF